MHVGPSGSATTICTWPRRGAARRQVAFKSSRHLVGITVIRSMSARGASPRSPSAALGPAAANASRGGARVSSLRAERPQQCAPWRTELEPVGSDAQSSSDVRTYYQGDFEKVSVLLYPVNTVNNRCLTTRVLRAAIHVMPHSKHVDKSLLTPEEVAVRKKLTADYQLAWESFTAAREQVNVWTRKMRAAERERARIADDLFHVNQLSLPIFEGQNAPTQP